MCLAVAEIKAYKQTLAIDLQYMLQKLQSAILSHGAKSRVLKNDSLALCTFTFKAKSIGQIYVICVGRFDK